MEVSSVQEKFKFPTISSLANSSGLQLSQLVEIVKNRKIDPEVESDIFHEYSSRVETTSGQYQSLTQGPSVLFFAGIGACTLGNFVVSSKIRTLVSALGGTCIYSTLAGHDSGLAGFANCNVENWAKGVAKEIKRYPQQDPPVVVAHSGAVPFVLKHIQEHPGSVKALVAISPMLELAPSWQPALNFAAMMDGFLGPWHGQRQRLFSYSKDESYILSENELLDVTFSQIPFTTALQLMPGAAQGRVALLDLIEKDAMPPTFWIFGEHDKSVNNQVAMDLIEPLRKNSTTTTHQVYVDSQGTHRPHLGPNMKAVNEMIYNFVNKNLTT